MNLVSARKGSPLVGRCAGLAVVAVLVIGCGGSGAGPQPEVAVGPRTKPVAYADAVCAARARTVPGIESVTKNAKAVDRGEVAGGSVLSELFDLRLELDKAIAGLTAAGYPDLPGGEQMAAATLMAYRAVIPALAELAEAAPTGDRPAKPGPAIPGSHNGPQGEPFYVPGSDGSPGFYIYPDGFPGAPDAPVDPRVGYNLAMQDLYSKMLDFAPEVLPPIQARIPALAAAERKAPACTGRSSAVRTKPRNDDSAARTSSKPGGSKRGRAQ